MLHLSALNVGLFIVDPGRVGIVQLEAEWNEATKQRALSFRYTTALALHPHRL